MKEVFLYGRHYPDRLLDHLRKFPIRLFVCLLFYAIATVFQLFHGGDMYEMRRKPEPTLLPTQGIFNLANHIGMVSEELWPLMTL